MVQRFCASTELSALIYFFTPHNVKWVMRYADWVVQAYLDFWFPQPIFHRIHGSVAQGVAASVIAADNDTDSSVLKLDA